MLLTNLWLHCIVVWCLAGVGNERRLNWITTLVFNMSTSAKMLVHNKEILACQCHLYQVQFSPYLTG
ncbi:unnamed protein product [Musa banksii]